MTCCRCRRSDGGCLASPVGRDGRYAGESPIRERHHHGTKHIRCGWRPENSRAARFAGAGIDIEIAIQLGEFRFRIFRAAEMLLHIIQRAEQSFFFAAPQTQREWCGAVSRRATAECGWLRASCWSRCRYRLRRWRHATNRSDRRASPLRRPYPCREFRRWRCRKFSLPDKFCSGC